MITIQFAYPYRAQGNPYQEYHDVPRRLYDNSNTLPQKRAQIYYKHTLRDMAVFVKTFAFDCMHFKFECLSGT